LLRYRNYLKGNLCRKVLKVLHYCHRHDGEGLDCIKTTAELDIKLVLIEALDLTDAAEPCLAPHRQGKDTIGADAD
jgi:hypothetical protein